MIHPDDRKYLEAEKAKVHDAMDSAKALSDLNTTLAYRAGYNRAFEVMRENGIAVPSDLPMCKVKAVK